MSEKRFNIKPQDDYWAVVDDYNEDKVCIINGIHTEIEAIWLCALLNDQQARINELEEEKIKLNEENKLLNAFLVHKGFAEEYIRWKRNDNQFEEKIYTPSKKPMRFIGGKPLFKWRILMMSEKERFVQSKYANHLQDTKTDTHYYLTSETIGCKDLFDEIERLTYENEQLRKQVAEYDMILRQHKFAEKEGFR